MTSVQKLSGIFRICILPWNNWTTVYIQEIRVSDAVINSKFQYAKKTIHGIRLAADELIVPDTISVEAYDIGIILSNGLDNAIEACQKLRRTKPEEDTYISIRSFWKGKMYFIEIENSFDGVMRMDTNSDWPCSTKPDSDATWYRIKEYS